MPYPKGCPIQITQLGVVIGYVRRDVAERISSAERDDTGCWGDGSCSYCDLRTGACLRADGTWRL
jgi:hypothetical protein